MSLPGFTAETSLYKTSGQYSAVAATSHTSQGVTPQLVCPLPGTCSKASQLCQDPTSGSGWCSILERCLDCMFGG